MTSSWSLYPHCNTSYFPIVPPPPAPSPLWKLSPDGQSGQHFSTLDHGRKSVTIKYSCCPHLFKNELAQAIKQFSSHLKGSSIPMMCLYVMSVSLPAGLPAWLSIRPSVRLSVAWRTQYFSLDFITIVYNRPKSAVSWLLHSSGKTT